MLAHPPARLPGSVGYVSNGDAGSPEPANGLVGALHGLVPDVERPVQVYQQPPGTHALMITGRRTAVILPFVLLVTPALARSQRPYSSQASTPEVCVAMG